MKRTSRVLAILLALAMLLSVTAFAAWDVYGGNANHNSVVTGAPTSANPSVTAIDLSNGGRGWDGVDNVPVMETVGTGDDAVTYAYVLYDGYSSYGGGAGYCYNASTKASVWSTTADTYALGGMACDNGIIVFGNDYDHLYVVK